uniref:Uncharacterized protein n=1 Tax=Solanum lycopersicum TaxID=4081 RepID=A0A3Q7IRA1_SOLLC
MEDQCSPLSWPYNYYLEEGIEELKHSLVYTTLELENTVISAHEELARKDEEILQLKDLLTRVMKERDEIQGKYCDENNVVSPPLLVQDLIENVVIKKPLPEKGKFLQAVMEAGPLLQTLLLAGPLPQWQHPPPQLNSIDIPPVTIASPTPRLLHQDSALSSSTGGISPGATTCFGQKRDVVGAGFNIGEGIDTTSKYQKVVHQSSLTNM